jgi:murein DD-endopeptidase MepM/ murein hydrolase activator NlpD
MNNIINKKIFSNLQKGLTFLFIFVLSFSFVLNSQAATQTDTKNTVTATDNNDVNVLDINNQLKDKRSKISDLKRQVQIYQGNIDKKQQEASSLGNELLILENEMDKNQLNIEMVSDEIEQAGLEIQQAQVKIKETEDSMDSQKEKLGEFIRQIYINDQANYLQILLENNSFSEFFEQVKYLELSQTELNKSLTKIEILGEELGAQKASIENNKKRLEELKNDLEGQKAILLEQKDAKQTLVDQTRLSEEKFQTLLDQARGEQGQIDSDIVTLEKTLKEKLDLMPKRNGEVSLMWPVDASRGISAYFHDPGYPFRYVFEHPAIDIRAYQGTPVKAAEDGYVARAKNAGMGYSYVMLLHDNNLATVYGHLSRISISEDTYVKKGQIIGLSGGSPGTPGAGPLTTGPHLHFEVRLNGIPVNALNYLP